MEGTNQTAAVAAPTNSAMPTGYAQAEAPPVRDEPSTSLPGIDGPGSGPANAGLPGTGPGSAGFGTPGQSMADGVSGSQRIPEYKQPIPGPGFTIGLPSNPNTSGSYSAELGFNAGPGGSPGLTVPKFQPRVTRESEVSQLVQQAAAQGQAQASDAYLSGISDASLEVLEHFGAEAPALLNQYACAVEDALIEQVQRGNSMVHVLEAAAEERGAMNIMLTNPDVLADYVNDFFGPNGPYPTETPDETAAREQYEARAQFEAEIEAQEMGRVPQQFQRPVQEMPTPGRSASQAQDFWGSFSEMMDSSPENAWKYLSQAPQGALSAKMLVQDL